MGINEQKWLQEHMNQKHRLQWNSSGGYWYTMTFTDGQTYEVQERDTAAPLETEIIVKINGRTVRHEIRGYNDYKSVVLKKIQ